MAKARPKLGQIDPYQLLVQVDQYSVIGHAFHDPSSQRGLRTPLHAAASPPTAGSTSSRDSRDSLDVSMYETGFQSA